MDNIAIYWDFENLHASLVDEREGEGAYGRAWFRPQPALVEVRPVLDYAASIGRVVVNRAYANWQHLAKYRTELLQNAVDLVQMFPLVGSKNGADILLAIDVVEDLHLLPHVSHVVIVGSDSDFVSLAQRCKRAGRTVIGIGVQRSTAPWWAAACDDYRLYNALLAGTIADMSAEGPISGPPLENPEDLEDARTLLARAIRNLTRDDADGWVVKAAVRPMMKRLDPSFDPIVLGYRNFNAFLAACEDLVTERVGEYDREFALRVDEAAPDVDRHQAGAEG